MPKRIARSGDPEVVAPDLDISELGRLLREKRDADGLSIRQAATNAQISFSTLSRVEAGAQPDLATFTSLCAWLGADPSRFFAPIAKRTHSPLDEAIEHLVMDPALTPGAALRIASVVRDLYGALAVPPVTSSRQPLALHLRASSLMRPGVPERLASLLEDMREALETQGAK